MTGFAKFTKRGFLPKNIKHWKKWIEPCDLCKSPFHYKCIPKKHRNKFGIKSEEDDHEETSFMCHLCVSDSDDNPLVLGDEEEDDE